jgi:hypothetical protein
MSARVDQFVKDLCDLVESYQAVGALHVPYALTEQGGLKCRLVFRESERVEEFSAEERKDIEVKLLREGFSSEGGHFARTREFILKTIGTHRERIFFRTAGISALVGKLLGMILKLGETGVSSEDTAAFARIQSSIEAFNQEIVESNLLIGHLTEKLSNLRV